ncbi:hypothetical protein D9M68_469450 [compost metagenome]
MLPRAHLRMDMPVWLYSVLSSALAWAQLPSHCRVHSSWVRWPSRMYCMTILLMPRSISVMAAVFSRKAFSAFGFSVARALSEPSYLLRNSSLAV